MRSRNFVRFIRFLHIGEGLCRGTDVSPEAGWWKAAANGAVQAPVQMTIWNRATALREARAHRRAGVDRVIVVVGIRTGRFTTARSRALA